MACLEYLQRIKSQKICAVAEAFQELHPKVQKKLYIYEYSRLHRRIAFRSNTQSGDIKRTGKSQPMDM